MRPRANKEDGESRSSLGWVGNFLVSKRTYAWTHLEPDMFCITQDV